MSSPIVPELLRLLEEATKRPREIRGSDDGAPEYEIVANGLIVGGFFEVAADGSREPIDQEADAALIVALVNAASALLDVAEAAEEYAAFDAHPHEEVLGLIEAQEKGSAVTDPQRIHAFYEAGKRMRVAVARLQGGPS